jgi:hypothetical protein
MEAKFMLYWGRQYLLAWVFLRILLCTVTNRQKNLPYFSYELFRLKFLKQASAKAINRPAHLD